MSRARHEEHKHRARGGDAGVIPDHTKAESYAGTDSDVEKEAERRMASLAEPEGADDAPT